MPLDIAKLKKALEGRDDGDELVEHVLNAVEEEKNNGIEARRKANNEAKNLRVFKKAFEGLGFKQDEHDLEEFVQSLGKSSNQQDSSEITKLRKSLEKLQEQFVEKEREASDLKDKSRKAKIQNELMKAIGDKIYGPNFVINDLINSGKVAIDDDNEDTILFLEGDSRIPFEKGVKTFLEKNQDLVKNIQRPGANSTSGSVNRSKYSLSDIDNLSVDDIIANKQDVLASLKT